MIPKLEFDVDYILKHSNDAKDTINYLSFTSCSIGKSKIPAYAFDPLFADLGYIKNYVGASRLSIDYGYADTEASLEKYLQKYVEDKDKDYFIKIGLMSTDYEKYHRNGSYINKDGENTEDDYFSYIERHPEMKQDQEYEGEWITFSICRLFKEGDPENDSVNFKTN